MERAFVDLEADAVAGAVQVPVAVAGLDEHVAAGAVDLAGRDAADDRGDPGALRRRHQFVQLALLRGRLADHVRPGHVGVVAVDERADVDDHGVALDDQPIGRFVVRTGSVLGTGRDDRLVAPVVRAEAAHPVLEFVADVGLGDRRVDRGEEHRLDLGERRIGGSGGGLHPGDLGVVLDLASILDRRWRPRRAGCRRRAGSTPTGTSLLGRGRSAGPNAPTRRAVRRAARATSRRSRGRRSWRSRRAPGRRNARRCRGSGRRP